MKFNNQNLKKPLIIAGPCSAETEDQVLQTAVQLKKNVNLDLLRAGIWKPRTRPGNFEGVGEKGLKWLVNAGKEINTPVTTEVANAKHVEQALKAGVDVLWIGARTTVNPFSVQEIADALKGVKVPVMIKNPINPDLQLWVGAIERIMAAGITNIFAVHRGFSSFEKTKYRNVPKWGIPIELMHLFPELPIICDPSHIGGSRELIESISQKALDMNMSGLMIETHPNPDKAWSDAKQQITPDKLGEIIKNLVVREQTPTDPLFLDKLACLRSEIDEIDEKLLQILAERFKLIEEIGTYKKENNTTILQPDRWFEILNSRQILAEDLNLNALFIDKLLKIIHQESVGLQTKIMNKK
ncbi:MAG: chorismate mutase [Putridiphycobacter sp.]